MPDKKQFQISEDYKEVSERVRDLYAKYPNAVLEGSYEAVAFGATAYIVYTAKCWRTPDDPRPSIGTAMEEIPGKTPYTKGSEIQNAETSAWGRAIVAAGASESKRIASADDIRSSREREEADAEAKRPAPKEHIDGFVAAMNGIAVGADGNTDEEAIAARRRKVKDAFVTRFGAPKTLKLGQVDDATAWIYEQIPELLDKPDDEQISGATAAANTAQSAAASPAAEEPTGPRKGEPAAREPQDESAPDGGEVGALSEAVTPPTSPPATDARPSTPQQRQTLGMLWRDLEEKGLAIEGDKAEVCGIITQDRTTTTLEITFPEAVLFISGSRLIQQGVIQIVNDPSGTGRALVSDAAPGKQFLRKLPGGAA